MHFGTVTFEKVSKTGEWKGICIHCGKKATRRREFMQTISPFNKINGVPKTYRDIMVELDAQIAEWKAKPNCHAKCKVKFQEAARGA